MYSTKKSLLQLFNPLNPLIKVTLKRNCVSPHNIHFLESLMIYYNASCHLLIDIALQINGMNAGWHSPGVRCLETTIFYRHITPNQRQNARVAFCGGEESLWKPF